MKAAVNDLGLGLRRCVTTKKDVGRKRKRKSKRKGEVIKEGDSVNISKLLFTRQRDYLVTSDGAQVKADRFSGKYIIIFFVSESSSSQRQLDRSSDLREAYTQLSRQGCAEIVTVQIDDTNWTATTTVPDVHCLNEEQDDSCSTDEEERKESFIQLLSTMPWPAIPHSDQRARQHIRSLFFSNEKTGVAPNISILDPMGKVLHVYADHYFKDYAAEGFPFIDESLRLLESRFQAARAAPSVETLLATPDRDFLLSSDGKKVPISSLQQKVVGLFFYVEGSTYKYKAERFKVAYNELLARGEKFEIVLVNFHFTYEARCKGADENLFWESFKSMPWLALPFRDPTCRNLWHIFDKPDQKGEYRGYLNASLAIIGPFGSYVEFFGADIFMHYGVEAYPFTRNAAAKIESAKLKEYSLNSLFNPEVRLTRKDKSQVYLSELGGKRIVVLLGRSLSREPSDFLTIMEAMYLKKKGKEDEFEVIYVSWDDEKSTYEESIAELPWLIHPFSIGLGDKIIGDMFKVSPKLSALVAFGPDGKFVGKAADVHKKKKGKYYFPFGRDLEKEIERELSDFYNWYVAPSIVLHYF